MKRIIFTFALSCITLFTFSQPVNNYVEGIQAASPEVAALAKFSEIPVSHFTGAASVNIPIHQLTEGPLSLAVSLNYHTSGIRVGEAASWVGLGWSLSAGGIVSRTILGLPDEETSGFLVSDYDHSNYNVIDQIGKGEIDGEPDLFHFSFGGYSGKFTLEKNSADEIEAIQYPRSDLKIITDSDQLDEFTLITPDGTKYYFGSIGTDTYHGFIYSNPQGPVIKSTGIPQKTEWYLRKIESFDGQYAIDLTYREEQYAVLSPSSEEYSKILSANQSGTTGFSQLIQNQGSFQVLPANNGRTAPPLYASLIGYRTKLISSISSSITRISFIPSTVSREDLDTYPYGDSELTNAADTKYLDRIQIAPITTGTGFCKQFNLAYGYFQDSANPTYTFDKRLKLESVSESSCSGPTIDIPPYVFDYHTEDGLNYDYLPWRLSKATDAWGYYNGQANNNNLDYNIPSTTLSISVDGQLFTETFGSANRNTSEAEMLLGTLKSVRYPESGITEFDLEANRVEKVEYETNIVEPSRGLGPWPEFSSCTGTETDPGNCCPEQEASIIFQLTPEMYQKGWWELSIFDVGCTDDVGGGPGQPGTIWDGYGHISLAWELDPNDITTVSFNSTTSGYSTQFKISEKFPNLIPGRNYILTLESWVCRADLNYLEEEVTEIITNPLVGGLRTKSIKTLDRSGSPLRQVDYDYTKENSPQSSSGVLYVEPVFGGLATNLVFSNVPYYAKFQFLSTPVLPLTDIQGYHLGYTHVKQSEDNGAYASYNFEANSVNLTSGAILDFPLPPLPYDYDNGVLEASTQGTSNKVVSSSSIIGSQRLGGSSKFGLRVARHVNDNGQVLLIPNDFRYTSGFYRKTRETVVRDGVSATSDFEYRNDYEHLNPISITLANSDNQVHITRYRYARELVDELGGTVYPAMVDQNRIGIPLETTMEVGSEPTQGQKTQYSFFSDADGTPAGSGLGPYPHLYQQYEVDWSGIAPSGTGNWNTLGEVEEMDINSGKPSLFSSRGWADAQAFEWDPIHRSIVKRTFKDFEWNYTYHPGTRLVSSMQDIDRLTVYYRFDALMRLKTLLARPKTPAADPAVNADFHQITTHDYHYYWDDSNNPYNHVISTRTFTDTPNDGSELSNLQQRQYLDDIGRPILSVQVGHSDEAGTAGQDVVIATEYDAYGRPHRVYEPYKSSHSDGRFITVPAQSPHTLTTYEESPLNRPESVTPPDWHATTYSYGKNNVAITSPSGVSYVADGLMVATLTDPEGLQASTYKDLKGRLILSRHSGSGPGEQSDTYYDYDHKDRLLTVFPPSADNATPDLLYHYTYDDRDNLISKQLPNQDFPIRYLYNDRNLMTFWQDANLRNIDRWVHLYYDAYGRQTQSGLVDVEEPTSPIHNTFTQLLSVTHYDKNLTGASDIYQGKVWKTETNILGTTDFLINENTYDDYGRVINIVGNNHLEITNLTSEQVSMSYDHAGNLLNQNRTHSAFNTQQTINQSWTFDQQGRNNGHFLDLNGNGAVQLSASKFTTKDQLAVQYLGGNAGNYLQKNDYAYLENGFLSTLNRGIGLDADDLFQLELRYDQNINASLGASQKNGNIGQIIWQLPGQEAHTYGFTYDYLNRLESATFGVLQNGALTSSNLDYNTNYSYDALGNIQTINRWGVKPDAAGGFTAGQIDALTFNYPTGSNQLNSIVDVGSSGFSQLGFDDHGQSGNYNYDSNGNLTHDPYKALDIAYNHLNLPESVTEISSANAVQWLYAADGTKLRKSSNTTVGSLQLSGTLADGTYQADVITSDGTVPSGGNVLFHAGSEIELQAGFESQSNSSFEAEVTPINAVSSDHDYISGIEYSNGVLEAIYHGAGRIYFDNGTPRYEYTLTDHLGNTRVTFADLNADGQVDETEILQENHYYPFGMEMDGDWKVHPDKQNQYQYNGKELNEDLGLNWLDYGARWYDPSVGRWNAVDPLAEEMANWSPYNYTFNNPLKFTDPTGMSPDDIIIGNEDLEKRWLAFENLQKLTNDVLTMDSRGKVTIAEKGGANTDKNLTDGTQLVSGLINDNNTTTIELGTGRGNGTFPVNESTDTEIRALAQEDFEYGANVYITGTDPTTANADGSRGLVGGAFITLGHELNHARDLVTSNFDRTVLSPVIDFDPTPVRVTNQFSKRELNTRIFENKLRNEQGLKARALPLPLSAFKFRF